MAKTDGGPAFPPNAGWVADDPQFRGMTLRDWFAGQALIGLSVGHQFEADSLAMLSYERADAMIKERSK